MDKFKSTDNGGIPVVLNDLRWAFGQIEAGNFGVYQALEGILKAFGDNFRVSGTEVTGSTVAEGWVMLEGELIRVDSHVTTDPDFAYYEKVESYDSTGDKTARSGASIQTWKKIRATATAATGVLEVQDSTLESLIRGLEATTLLRGTVLISTDVAAKTGTVTDRALTPANLTATLAQAYTTPSLNTNFSHVSSNNLKYRLIHTKLLQLKGGFTASVITGTTPFTLPAGFRPSENRMMTAYIRSASNDDLSTFVVMVTPAGEFYPANYLANGVWSSTSEMYFDDTIPLD